MRRIETVPCPKPEPAHRAATAFAVRGMAKPERSAERPAPSKPTGPVTYTQSKGADVFWLSKP